MAPRSPPPWIFCLSALLALAPACEGQPEGEGDEGSAVDEAPGPERRVLVEAAPAGPGSVADHLVTSGTLDSDSQADIMPEAAGLITQVLAEVGEPVRAGQVLAVLANPSLDANADRASIELQKARQALDESERLFKQGAISESELRTARNALAAAETSFNEARRSRGFTRITSPIAGTLAVRDVRVGEVASGGKRAFQVVDMSRLRVVVQLPEKDLPRIRLGQPATLEGAYDEQARAAATVELISPVVDAATGTVQVTIRLAPDQSTLRPGQFVKVRLEVDRRDEVLTIPRRALLYDEGEPIAWRVIEGKAPEAPTAPEGEAGAEGEPSWWTQLFADEPEAQPEGEGEGAPAADPWAGVQRRAVEKVRLQVGFADQDRAEILEGLAAGDLVVTVGNANLREEVLVKLPGDADPPPAAEGSGDSEGKSSKRGRGGARRGGRR